MFLGKYKLMLGSDCRLIYGTTDYHRKRLKVLESERYIRRVNRLYIKLDDKGTRLEKNLDMIIVTNVEEKNMLID